MGSRARLTGATVRDSNDKPPYRHWHTVCAVCGKVTLARACKMPGEIDPIEHNPVIRYQHCEGTRQYLDKDCFLAPLSAAGSSDKAGGITCSPDNPDLGKAEHFCQRASAFLRPVIGSCSTNRNQQYRNLIGEKSEFTRDGHRIEADHRGSAEPMHFGGI